MANSIIMVNEGECWVCGMNGGLSGVTLTKHHVLPKHLNPMKNILVPVCTTCHDKINEVDFKGVRDFAFKIMKTSEEQLAMVTRLTEIMRVVEKEGAKSENIVKRIAEMGKNPAAFTQFDKGYLLALQDLGEKYKVEKAVKVVKKKK